MKNIYIFLIIAIITCFTAGCNLPRIDPAQDVEACFTVSNNQCIAPCEITFNGTCSKNAKSYFWDFGDDNTGNGMETSHIYTSTGNFIVKLSIEGFYSQSHSTTDTITIVHDSTLVACFRVDSISCSGYAPAEVFITNCSQNAITYHWDWDDNTASVEANPQMHEFTTGGNFSIVLTVEDIHGNVATSTKKITIKESITFQKKFPESGGQNPQIIVTNPAGGFLIGGIHSRSSTDRDFWLMKIDNSGNLIGNNQFYGGSSDHVLYDFNLARDGRLVFCGDNIDSSDGNDFYVMSTDGNGNNPQAHNWDFNMEDNHCRSLVELQNGGFAFAGRTKGNRQVCLVITDHLFNIIDTVFYGNGSNNRYYAEHVLEDHLGWVICGDNDTNGNGGRDGWLFRINKNNYQIDPSFGFKIVGSKGDYIWDMAKTRDGGYILVGQTFSFSNGSSDVWIIRTDLEGAIIWRRNFGGPLNDEARGVIELNEGGFAIVGKKAISSENEQAWLLVVDDIRGDLSWDKTFGYANSKEIFGSVIQTPDCGFMLLGRTNQNGVEDVFLVKTDSKGDL